MDLLITCKPHFEKIVSRELDLYSVKTLTLGNGWIRCQSPISKNGQISFLNRACFAAETLCHPSEILASSANGFIDELIRIFLAHIGRTRVEDPWPFMLFSSDDEQLRRRVTTIEKGWMEKLRKKTARVAKLASPGLPRGEVLSPGFFVYFTDFNRALAAFSAHSAGQKRMRMDNLAPSRSYLKIEEACHIFGRGPERGETVIDLGAAPGGWSHSALKRGAYVTAVDNGPLKDPVKSHPGITHLREDALRFCPGPAGPADWLFCDIIEDPGVILSLTKHWLKQRWCRQFIVNLKLGRRDPVPLLKHITDPSDGLARGCRRLIIRQLYHDREEITLMGECRD